VPTTFVIYPELRPGHGIHQTRVSIADMMRRGTFPPAVQISAGRVGWRLEDIEHFKETRPAQGEPMPVLWPVRPRRPKPTPAPGATPVGRPQGSRIVVDVDGRRRLVLPVAQAEPRVTPRFTRRAPAPAEAAE
jgi:predicted DNA-binding transcriptional regulator AlpA